MKKILITGTNSYIGNSLSSWLTRYPDDYSIDTISLRDNAWKAKDFSDYNVVFHVAGIAHVSSDPNMEEEYYRVNRDLTIETAEKAKHDGVEQFIFMSSIIVYGDSSSEEGLIDRKTEPNPSNFYGDSKLQAEKGIFPLDDDKFKVAVIRPPMIYGKNSKGNYLKLAKAARKLPVFPDIDNQRSMLHVDNLCEFIKLMIDNEERGLFFPQNTEYVKTSEMVKAIGALHGRKVILIKLFNPLIKLCARRVNTLNKVFGDLRYDKEISKYKENYNVKGFLESIKATEK